MKIAKEIGAEAEAVQEVEVVEEQEAVPKKQ